MRPRLTSATNVQRAAVLVWIEWTEIRMDGYGIGIARGSGRPYLVASEITVIYPNACRKSQYVRTCVA